jgi:hypothetical protein
MKRMMRSLASVFAIAMTAALVSFDMKPGAHSFQVFVDNKMIIERYADHKLKAPNVQLSSENKTLDVRYNECNRTVSGRSLTAKDNDENVLKVWRFEGSTSGLKDAMSFSVKEVQGLAQKSGNAIRIYYSSNDFPEGLHIFTAVVGNTTVVSGN